MADSFYGAGTAMICALCLGEMSGRKPKALACLHTFCEDCLVDISSSKDDQKEGKISCPTCRKETVLPAGGIKALPVNFMVESLSDQVSNVKVSQESPVSEKKKESSKEQGWICASCEKKGKKSYATFKCEECDIVVCTECKDKHCSYKIFQNHTLTAVAQNRCRKHGKEIKYVCTFCPEETCVDCVMQGDHEEHSSSIKEYTVGLKEAKEQSAELFQQVVQKRDTVENNICAAQQREAIIKEMKMEIQKRADQFRRRIATCEQEMLDAMDRAFAQPTEDRLKLLYEEHGVMSNHIDEYKRIDDQVQRELYLQLVGWTKSTWEDTMMAKGAEETVLEPLPNFVPNSTDIEIGKFKKA